MVGENGIPETPDWVPTPRPSPFDDALTIPPNIILGSE